MAAGPGVKEAMPDAILPDFLQIENQVFDLQGFLLHPVHHLLELHSFGKTRLFDHEIGYIHRAQKDGLLVAVGAS